MNESDKLLIVGILVLGLSMLVALVVCAAIVNMFW